MEKWLKPALFAAVIAIIVPTASAHERQAFKVGDKAYTVVIGFANEPVFVNEKSGVYLRVRLADPRDPVNFSSPNGKPVEKLEKSLEVEISAGDKKKVFAFEPAFGDPGVYRAHFFPTAATTYRVRVFGELNATPVDLTFTCSPAGHPPSGADRSEVKLSGRVTRIFKSGSFACPAAKEAVEFP